MQDMRRIFLPKFIEICIGHRHGGRKPIETSVTEFFLQKIKSLFNQLGRHANAASRKSLEIQA